jgi:Protein of unknown function (DUF732)
MTEQDHTTASAAGADADTTIVPSDPATVDALAWSEGDEPADDERHPWGAAWELAATIIACTALLAGALIAWHVILSHHDAQASAPTTGAAAVVPVVVTTVTESPVTVTVTPTPITPPAATALVFTNAQDQWLLTELQTRGVTVGNPTLMINGAHQYCQLLASGAPNADGTGELEAITGVRNPDTVMAIVRSALDAYPHC